MVPCIKWWNPPNQPTGLTVRDELSASQLKVKIFDKNGTQVLNLGKSAVTIGSASHCDVVVDHPSVSGEHARAWLEGGRIWVQDLGSKEGTSLNGARLMPLKPLFVRDLDTLCLGACESRIGLEMNVVRSPVVKNTATAVKTAQPPIATASPEATPQAEPTKAAHRQRQEDLESVARELADSKRQLQLAKLELKSGEEIFSQLETLRRDLQTSQQSVKTNEDKIRQLEAAALKMRQTQESRKREETHRLDAEKRESLVTFAQRLRGISIQLSQRWTTRPLSQDMIFEWESETIQTFQAVVLPGSDHAQAIPALPPLDPVVNAKLNANMEAQLDATVVAIRALPVGDGEAVGADRRSKSRRRRRSDQSKSWRRVFGAAAGFCVVLTSMWFGLNWMREAGMTSFSSHDRTPKSIAPKKTPKVQPFAPKQNRQYRGSYTDNILFLENYVEAELNPEFRLAWLTSLTQEATRTWKLDAASVRTLVRREEVAIQDLVQLRSQITVEREHVGLMSMKAREKLFQDELESMLKTKASVDRFFKFKKQFYLQNQAYLKREMH